MHKIWDFERKCFVDSHDLVFEETQFPRRSDFDEPPADTYDPRTPSPSPEPTLEQEIRPPPQTFEEIVVQQPPALQVFSTYGEFQPDNDPPSFSDAMRRPDADLWWDAFCDEIKAIIARKTWTLATLPPGKRALPLRWVCRTKRDATNVFEKYKARIVVKGYAQEAELDFDETFAPVIRIDSVRILFAISAGKDLYIIQVDCTNAFLHSKSDFEIYVLQPEGFVDVHQPHAVLLLNKALYGLKQAPRLWYLLLSEVILGMGFQVLESDTSIYIHGEIILAVYVDDILIAGPSVKACNKVVHELSRKVEVVNKGEVRSFLGLNVARNYAKHAISISQPGYIDRLLAKYNMTNARSASTPFEYGTKLRSATANDTLCIAILYQELTGSLNHLAVFSRPDISFAVSKLSKYNSNPTTTHFKAALHVLRYLKSTRNYCIVYRKSTKVPIIDVVGYSDSDFASDEDDRKSIYRLRIHYKRGSGLMVNTQAVYSRIIQYGGRIYGIIRCRTRGACKETAFQRITDILCSKTQSPFSRTAKRHSIFQKTQRITVEQSISIYDIMRSDITFTTERLKSTISPRIINLPTYSRRRSDPQSITGFALWSVYATATKHLSMLNVYEEVF
jgi:hypothetical protein